MKKNINILYFVALFLLLLYSFNMGISNIIYPINSFFYISLIIAVLIIIILSINKKINKNIIVRIFTMCLLIMFAIIFRNEDIKYGAYYNKIFSYIVIIISFSFLIFSDKWLNHFKNIMLFFILEHVIVTWIFAFFPNFYLKNIIPIFQKSYIPILLSQYKHGYITGLTRHYSHNGMYLGIGMLFFFSKILKEKNFKNILLFTITTGALLLTGKRGQFIFAIFAILFVSYINNKKTFINIFVKKVIPITIITFLLIFVVGKFVPAINNTFMRLSWLSSSDDITNGRSEMYKIMIEMWKDNPLFGAGWGKFKYNGISEFVNGHNVYLQILAECGIIGELVFLYVIYKIFSLIKSTYIMTKNNSEFRFYVIFLLQMQIFFVLYCITGNPLYDVQILFPLSISIASVYAINLKLKKENNNT